MASCLISQTVQYLRHILAQLIASRIGGCQSSSFEVANPIGSAKCKYKILGFYVALGNLQLHDRSAIDHIQLVMLGLERDIIKNTHRVFKRLVQDLKVLETDGIEVGGHRFHVIVPAIAGDNLGSHWLGGFVTNFSTV